jgi:hypothetical protein
MEQQFARTPAGPEFGGRLGQKRVAMGFMNKVNSSIYGQVTVRTVSSYGQDSFIAFESV